MLLAYEMVAKAKELPEQYVWLKVDVIKAFDKLERRFMVLLMRKIGMDEGFIKFFMAITVNANAVVLVNGRATGEVRITRSVRQGCPIAPLLFTLLLEALNWMFKKAMLRGTLKGLYFDEIEVHLVQQFYSDNTSVMIEATAANARTCEQIFDTFGRASGLKVNWAETAALMISDQPRPAEMERPRTVF
jgi:hypothetical protein